MPQRAAATIFCLTVVTRLDANDGTSGRPRHPLRLVAAARRERARRGTRPGAARARSQRHRARAVESRARPRRRPPRARDRARRRVHRPRPGGADLAAQPDGRPGRRAREPRRRARGGQLRHRARLRARAAEPLVSRAPRRGRADGRDVLLRRSGSPYPPARNRRERLLGRLDALLATSAETAEAAAERFPGRYEIVPLGVDRRSSRRPKRKLDRARVGTDGAPAARARSRASSLRSRTGSSRSCVRARSGRGRRCRARSAAARGSAPRSTPRLGRACSAKPPSSCPRPRASRASSSRRAPPARPSPRRPAARDSRSSPPPRRRG